MVRSVWDGGKYFLVGLFGAVLIGTILGSPLPQQDESSNEIDSEIKSIYQQPESVLIDGSTAEQMISSRTTTTEHPHNAIARIYMPPQDQVGTMKYASGVHMFRIGHNEDKDKRTLEEYNYHFVRREMNLPPTTKRNYLGPPSKY